MAVVRRNILSDASVRDRYVQGLRLLKQEDSGVTTRDVGIPGPERSIGTYDLFVVWHHRAMMTMTPPGNSAGRNAAHRGPVFLPWHRVMLIFLEQNLRRVLAEPETSDFGLPYWDWGADGDLPAGEQSQSPIWASDCMGGQGSPVATGPFAFDPASPGSWRVRIAGTAAGGLRSVDRGLRRSFAGPGAATLPTSTHVRGALGRVPYDASPWAAASEGFRNHLEGWRVEPGVTPPGLHNRVHVWVGGDMEASTSPNDPVFYLNHCNVDRAWEKWMQENGRVYLPDMSAGPDLAGHRIDDAIVSPLGSDESPGSVLDVTALYAYDALPA